MCARVLGAAVTELCESEVVGVGGCGELSGVSIGSQSQAGVLPYSALTPTLPRVKPRRKPQPWNLLLASVMTSVVMSVVISVLT